MEIQIQAYLEQSQGRVNCTQFERITDLELLSSSFSSSKSIQREGTPSECTNVSDAFKLLEKSIATGK